MAAVKTTGIKSEHTADGLLTEVLCHLDDEVPRLTADRRVRDTQRVVDLRQRAVDLLITK
jgi:hypothetical protein